MNTETFKNYSFLFDIDGTLLTTDGTGRKAMNKSLYNLYSIKNALNDISLAGATDLGIFNRVLENHKLELNNKKSSYENWQIEYATQLSNYFEAHKNKSKPCKGIINFLNILKNNNIKTKILTGNTVLGAFLKIKHAGLASFFYPEIFQNFNQLDWQQLKEQVLKMDQQSIYGDVSENRNDLPVEILKRNPGKKLIIFGDTEKDIECALKNSQISVAVKTGFGNMELMEKMKPHIFSDFLKQNVLDDLEALIKSSK